MHEDKEYRKKEKVEKDPNAPKKPTNCTLCWLKTILIAKPCSICRLLCPVTHQDEGVAAHHVTPGADALPGRKMEVHDGR